MTAMIGETTGTPAEGYGELLLTASACTLSISLPWLEKKNLDLFSSFGGRVRMDGFSHSTRTTVTSAPSVLGFHHEVTTHQLGSPLSWLCADAKKSAFQNQLPGTMISVACLGRSSEAQPVKQAQEFPGSILLDFIKHFPDKCE